MRSNNSHHLGFTLIEVLVALTILAAGFSVIFPMFQQAQNSNHRVEQIERQILEQQTVYLALATLNPAVVNSGRGELGDLRYQWQAVPISAPIPVRTEDGMNPMHGQMFRLDVSYQQGERRGSFQFEQLGWEVRR
ncbi:type II secretion system protein [Vibrio metschnikovii]|uniref:type II secretion system protein n=1 Tax=Vibrio metschnikovii TaxID=28172 RepID=UPI002974EA1C|nr:prepilin-type N-terminal cleavage/methylation domain-containing protein [Vibrio metschnikovii]EKO3659852.1 prepilin-type N-terminal cleavage/methylation domain-containing protein [Vibrio metschnikovii]EKO3677096.1 prepilin-type N-terminal cleavage/methylation domain-containing protein [Vibrio metschnikovii]